MPLMINIKIGTIALFALLFCSEMLDAQYYESDSAFVGRKNSIMLLTNPLLQVALNSTGRTFQTGIQYKRLINPNKRLNFGFGFEAIDFIERQNQNPINLIADATDSVLILRKKKSIYNRFHISSGIEWSDFSQNHGFLYGVGLQLGIRKELESSYLNHHIKSPIDSTSLEMNYYAAIPDSTEAEYDYTNSYVDFAVALQIGYRINIKEKWEVNLTFSPQFNVYFATQNQWNLNTPQPLDYQPSNGFEMQLRLLMVDIGYRF
jgi:hypothetical protein